MSSGAMSRDKGIRAERDLANYLRQWFDGADRYVRAGYRTRSRTSADPGDIKGVPGVIISCKHYDEKKLRKPSVWAEWWAELDAMLEADPAALGVIVERRNQAPDPSTWWAHLRLGDLVSLYGGTTGPSAGDRAPARVSLETFIELLVAAGYHRGAA